MFYCSKHADSLIGAVRKGTEEYLKSDEYEADHCMACGVSFDNDLDVTFATCYMPGMEQLSVRLEHCFACAVAFRAEIQENGQFLPNREELRPRAPETSPWARVFELT
jgi:methionyl-tRNA synthetase